MTDIKTIKILTLFALLMCFVSCENPSDSVKMDIERESRKKVFGPAMYVPRPEPVDARQNQETPQQAEYAPVPPQKPAVIPNCQVIWTAEPDTEDIWRKKLIMLRLDTGERILIVFYAGEMTAVNLGIDPKQ